MAKRGPGRPKSNATLDESVDILNGEVPPKNNPQSSPKRRKRDGADENSPAAKKRVLEGSAEESRVRRRSTRLSRPSASTAQLHSGNAEQKQSRDPFEVPSDPPRHSTPSPPKPKKAMNSPHKAKPVPNEETSAFEVEEGEEGAANPLMTSPASNTRSIHKRVRSIGQTRDGENLIVDIQPVKKVQRRQRLLNGNKRKTEVLPNRRTASFEVAERSSVRQHAPVGQELLAARSSTEEIGTQRNQPSASDAPQTDQDRSSPGEEHVESVGRQSVNGEPDEAPQRPGTKEVFDRASGLYGCKRSWDAMLEANCENLHDADKGNQGSEIRELDDLIKRAKLAYRAIRHAEGADVEDKDYEIEELLVDIGRSVHTIQPGKNRKKNSRLVKDIYVQGIPKLVQLLKAALVTRSLSGELSIPSLKELVYIIDTALKLCMKAHHWLPRPTLEYGVKRRTRNVVKMSLEALRKAYTEAQYESLDEEEEEVRKVEKRQAIADHVAKFLAQQEEKEKRVEDNKRERYRATSRPSLNEYRVQAREFDIDELGINDASPAQVLTGTKRNLPWRGTGVVAARQSLSLNGPAPSAAENSPRMSRERTEDIPGPMGLQWSKSEDTALLDGLERFTGANRYLEIDEAYGSPGGLLRGRDVDELMERARFYKQSMASHIVAEEGMDRWAWLLSVEG